MANSWFTLCPRGDRPWSHRLYEAVMSRSIGVVKSFEQDVNHDQLCLIPYKYVLWNSSHFDDEDVVAGFTEEKLKDIAEYNYNLFIKYQTDFQGDNEIPNPSRRRNPWAQDCNSIAVP
eukprot:UN4438